MFDKIPNQANSHVIYVVLPFRYETVKTLVEYMYCGESRVSNDILKEVLHGGDFLKIRGLCRSENGSGGGKENNCSDLLKGGTKSVVEVRSPPATPLNTFSSGNVHDRDAPGLQKVATTNQSTKSQLKGNHRPPVTTTTTSQPPTKTLITKPPPQVQAKVVARNSVETAQEVMASSNINYLTIKEEPVEWTDQFETVPSTVKDLRIKEETIDLPGTEYQRLSCEICRESFRMPAEWVRHVEHKHTELTLTIPKKRRKSGFVEDDDNIASLRCDLCSTYFLTPAEWVKHVQSKHTEMELAMENEKLSLAPTHGGNNKAASYSGSKR